MTVCSRHLIAAMALPLLLLGGCATGLDRLIAVTGRSTGQSRATSRAALHCGGLSTILSALTQGAVSPLPGE